MFIYIMCVCDYMCVDAFVTQIWCFVLWISSLPVSWCQRLAATWRGWSDTFPGLASPTPPGGGGARLDWTS